MRSCARILVPLCYGVLFLAANGAAQSFPTPATTGVPQGTVLKACGDSPTITSDNTVIDSCIYTGDITIQARNVRITRSEIRGVVRTSATNSDNWNFTIEDSTVGPTSGCNAGASSGAIGHKRFTARRVHVRNSNEGFRLAGGDVDAIIEDSYVKLCKTTDAHPDGIQGYNPSCNEWVRAVFNHNTVDTRGVSGSAPTFFAGCSPLATVTNNLLMGGTAPLRIQDSWTPDHGPWVISGNRLVDKTWTVGPVINSQTECDASTMSWSDNRLVTIDSNYKILSVGALVDCQGDTSTSPTVRAPLAPTNIRIVKEGSVSTPPTYALVYSSSTNRTNAQPLAASTVAGNIYVFSSPDTSDIVRVSFWVDNTAMSGSPRYSEANAPYDFAGATTSGANPFDSRTLTNGAHTISTKIDFANGTSLAVHTTFTVSN